MNNSSHSRLKNVPEEIKQVFNESKKYFPTPIQQMQFFDKYARYSYKLGRREAWTETVDRTVNYLKELSENKLSKTDYDRINKFILEMKVMPSMRMLAMAGPAARRNGIAIYNCSYLPLDSIDSLVEVVIVAMAGCGVGWSVEKQYTEKFPEVKMQSGTILPTFVTPDSTEGWAETVRVGLEAWINGNNLQFDFSKIRKSGTPLKIKGGRASGPESLESLMNFIRNRILSRQGQRLSSLDLHDIACKIGEAIVSGGVRRTACISLFDLDDEEMRNCKNQDLTGNEQRWMANNSAVWTSEMTQDKILRQMYEMIQGQRGEPGIFSRHNANMIAPERRRAFGYKEYGTNPCGEINLRPYQFCNLSQVIARPDDTIETLLDKVEVATIIGTIQSMSTNFPGLRPIWKENCEEERLLGVDVNGQMDCPLFQPNNSHLKETFATMRSAATEVNKKYAKILGINESSAITCVKPNGNSSQLLDCSSGLHPRHYKYYIRNVRVQASSPLRKLMDDQGVPMDVENGQSEGSANTYVIHFPIKSPEGAITKEHLSALDQCNHWLANKLYWTDHNPSITVMYRPDEVIDLIKWVADHKDFIGGMSFLPLDNAQYNQMPYEEISEEEYELLEANFPDVDFSQLYAYEHDDFTTVSNELACTSGVCSLDEYQAKRAAEEAHLIPITP